MTGTESFTTGWNVIQVWVLRSQSFKLSRHQVLKSTPWHSTYVQEVKLYNARSSASERVVVQSCTSHGHSLAMLEAAKAAHQEVLEEPFRSHHRIQLQVGKLLAPET